MTIDANLAEWILSLIPNMSRQELRSLDYDAGVSRSNETYWETACRLQETDKTNPSIKIYQAMAQRYWDLNKGKIQ